MHARARSSTHTIIVNKLVSVGKPLLPLPQNGEASRSHPRASMPSSHRYTFYISKLIVWHLIVQLEICVYLLLLSSISCSTQCARLNCIEHRAHRQYNFSSAAFARSFHSLFCTVQCLTTVRIRFVLVRLHCSRSFLSFPIALPESPDCTENAIRVPYV